ncbi:hypothetical protein QAD02_011423 [Eretmocerus hayati]|uniref:Uncharacterized protein n=1 Tax=Eretmocerus hayati TaxID=131215 RepID=A0ACC2NWZ8_9HYME|nr:hypothetical protein QAD02_011423 [Eretmocerus hayati]
MQVQEPTIPEVSVISDKSARQYKLTSCNSLSGRTRRKTRSTRRRLNALVNNVSLHFSDSDSEGELATRAITPTNPDKNFLQPVISVTLDNDDSSICSERRSSFVENLTDVDEIYPSDGENGIIDEKPRKSLTVVEQPHLLSETDYEDVSNDEEEEAPILIEPRNDILVDFNGETITTKEGDGPFSVEVRNQMSVDDDAPVFQSQTPDIVIMPTTDSEEMEASDEDEEEAACALSEPFEPLDVQAASQIVMKNVDKSEQQFLAVKDPDDAVSDSLTDVEDIE